MRKETCKSNSVLGIRTLKSTEKVNDAWYFSIAYDSNLCKNIPTWYVIKNIVQCQSN